MNTPRHPKTEPKVSVIVLCWNNRALLDECFNSVYTQSYANWEIIMVDNGSADDSVAHTTAQHPKVHVIETGENLGFAIGNNLGFKHALKDPTCKYIMLLNTDAVIAPNWMEKLVAFAEAHPKGASFQSPTFDYYDHEMLDSCGILVDRQALATQIGYQQTNAKLETRRVFGVNAAAALYSRAFLDAQPFGDDYLDHDLWMYLEDVDLAARAVMMGWESWLVNESSAYHMGSASSAKLPGFYSLYMTYRNNALVLLKNLPWRIILKALPGLLRAELNRLRGFWRERKYPQIRAILLGRLRSISRIPLFLRKRRLFKHYWNISETELWELMKVPVLAKIPSKERPYGSESVAVIVLSHNNRDTLGRCLDAIKAQTYPNMRLVVVDNASTDGSAEYLKETHPDIVLLMQQDNLGLPNGFNVGLTEALKKRGSDYFALIQGNTVVDPDWIDVMVGTMRQKPRAFAVASKLLESEGGETLNQGYGYHPAKGVKALRFKDTAMREVLATSDYASFYRTSCLAPTGLMDGDFFDGLEDVDFCFRGRLMGFSTYSQPKAVASTTVHAADPRYRWYHTQKNLMFIYIKNLPFKLFVKYLPATFLAGLGFWGTALRRGFILQQLKASVKCVIRLPHMLRSRHAVNVHRQERSGMIDKLLRGRPAESDL